MGEIVSEVRELFEQSECASTVEEKTSLFDAAVSEAKDAIEDCIESRDVIVVKNLMKTYWVKLVEYISSTGEKTSEDLINLLLSSFQVPEYVESLKIEDPKLYAEYDEFLHLAANDKKIVAALQSAAQKSK